MQYIETDLIFNEASLTIRSGAIFNLPAAPENNNSSTSEVLGIKLRLGNQPLAYDLEKLQQHSGKATVHPKVSGTRQFMVVHVMSALRIQGKARVDELHYSAVSSNPLSLQTIGLIPQTKFDQFMKGSFGLSGALNIFGQVSTEIPPIVTETLVNQFIDLGAGMKFQLCTASEFIGKYTFNLQTPIIQSSGMGSNACDWIIYPNEEKIPLLGDQLLIQLVSVPCSCDTLNYTISGLVRADRGIFWRQQELRTPQYNVEVKLPIA